MVTVFNVLFGVVPGTAAGAHGNGDKQAGDDGAHQQAAQRFGAEQQANQNRHHHGQQRRNDHFLDGGGGQHVYRSAVVRLAFAGHDLTVSKLAAHFHHD